MVTGANGVFLGGYRLQNADRERSASPERRGRTPLNPPSSDVTLLSDPPVSPTVSSSQGVVMGGSGLVMIGYEWFWAGFWVVLGWFGNWSL